MKPNFYQVALAVSISILLLNLAALFWLINDYKKVRATLPQDFQAIMWDALDDYKLEIAND